MYIFAAPFLSLLTVYPFFSFYFLRDYSPLVMKVRSRSGSVMSGASTPGGGAFKSLSEGDLKKADAALSQVNGTSDTNSTVDAKVS